MHAFQDLYVQNPFWLWMAVGAVFVAMDIATGSGKLMWSGVAAAVLAFLNLAEVRLGPSLELGVFAAVTIVGVALALGLGRRPAFTHSEEDRAPDREVRAPESQLMSVDRSERLIGRIGRTTGDFANGVGRVFIDGSDWAAEIDRGEDIPNNVPVRIMAVTGGVRLQVRGLAA